MFFPLQKLRRRWVPEEPQTRLVHPHDLSSGSSNSTKHPLKIPCRQKGKVYEGPEELAQRGLSPSPCPKRTDPEKGQIQRKSALMAQLRDLETRVLGKPRIAYKIDLS